MTEEEKTFTQNKLQSQCICPGLKAVVSKRVVLEPI